MNKVIHGLVTAVFGIGCLFLWGLLTLISQVAREHPVPAFSRLCVDLRPVLIVMPIVAAAYCVYVWIRKPDGKRPWVNFFAATMGVLVLAMLPTLTATYLPLFDWFHQLSHR